MGILLFLWAFSGSSCVNVVGKSGISTGFILFEGEGDAMCKLINCQFTGL